MCKANSTKLALTLRKLESRDAEVLASWIADDRELLVWGGPYIDYLSLRSRLHSHRWYLLPCGRLAHWLLGLSVAQFDHGRSDWPLSLH